MRISLNIATIAIFYLCTNFSSASAAAQPQEIASPQSNSENIMVDARNLSLNDSRPAPPGVSYLIADLRKSSALPRSFRTSAFDNIGAVRLRPNSLVETIARAERSIPTLRIVAGRWEIWLLERRSGQANLAALESELEGGLDSIPSLVVSSAWFRGNMDSSIDSLNDILADSADGETVLSNTESLVDDLSEHLGGLLRDLGGAPGGGPIFLPEVGGGAVAESDGSMSVDIGDRPNEYGGRTTQLRIPFVGGGYDEQTKKYDANGALREDITTHAQDDVGVTYYSQTKKYGPGGKMVGATSVVSNPNQTKHSSYETDDKGNSTYTRKTTTHDDAAERAELKNRPGSGDNQEPDDTDTSKEEEEEEGSGGSGRTVDGDNGESGRGIPIPLQYRFYVSQEPGYLPNEGGALPIDPASGARQGRGSVPGLSMISVTTENDAYLETSELRVPGGRLGVTPPDPEIDGQIIYQVHVIDPAEVQQVVDMANVTFEQLLFEAQQ